MHTLRALREQHFISRKALAQEAGVSESTIVRIEDGQHRTRQDIAKKVVEALSRKTGAHISVESLAGLSLYNAMRDRRNRSASIVQGAVLAEEDT